MDEQKDAEPNPSASSLVQSTITPEDAKTVESKEIVNPVTSIEEKTSELVQTNKISSNVTEEERHDEIGVSDKSGGQKDQPLPEGSSSDKGGESFVKTVVESVNKETEKSDVVPPADTESSGKNVIERVDQGVAEMKLTEQSGIVDTSKAIDEEDLSVINENVNTINSQENSDQAENKVTETVDEVPMDLDLPHPAQEPVQPLVNTDEEKIPVKDEEDDNQEEELFKTEDWDFPPSDSEEGHFSSQPPPHVIIELYEKLAKEDILELEWTCLGKRTPEEEVQQMEIEDASKESQEEMVNKPVEEDRTEFDFDIDNLLQNKVTPRRMAVFDQGGSGSAKKRVAQMDKVINDLKRFSKINEEMVKTGDSAQPDPTNLEVTPQRPLGKFHIRRDLHQ